MPQYGKPSYNVWKALQDRASFGGNNKDPLMLEAAHRYPYKSLDKLDQAIEGDFSGNIPSPLPVHVRNFGGPAAGITYPGGKRIDLQPWVESAVSGKKPYEPLAPGILLHEMAHSASESMPGADLTGEGMDQGSPNHFMRGFGDTDLAQMIKAQNALESDLPVDPYVYQNMPWLKKVVPLSSNKLANPWSYHREEMLQP